MCGPYYPHSVRGRTAHVEVYQAASIPGNGEELLKKQFLSSISRLGVGPIGPTPNLELLEKNCFLRRFHRKVAQECPPGCSTTLFSGGALRHRWHSETRHSDAVALKHPVLRAAIFRNVLSIEFGCFLVMYILKGAFCFNHECQVLLGSDV